jgi:FAS-associated factor 2
LAELLQTALVEHGGLLWEERIVQEQRENDRRLREEQDAEYQQSLEADRARELERKRAEELERQKQFEKEEAERLERERIEAERMEQERIDQALQKRREHKKATLEEEPTDEAEVAVIRVRFPSGETHQRKFSRQSSLQKVFDWVESLDCNVFQHFSLSTTYPRRILTEEQAMQSLEELEFSRQTALVVQPEE